MTGSRDEKTDTTIELLGYDLPQDHSLIPQICNGCSEKLTIKIWGLEPKNHVIGSRDEKSDATTELLGYEIPHKKVQTDIMATFGNSLSPRNSLYL